MPEAEVKYFLGIDPGVSGAFAIIDQNYKVLELHSFSSFHFIHDRLSNYKITMAVMEEVFIWRGSAAKGSTTFMKNAGGWEALLEVLDIPHALIKPDVWMKSTIGLVPRPKTKGMEKKAAAAIKRKHTAGIKLRSISKANKLFVTHLQPKDDGKADALNMARYAMNHFHFTMPSI